MTDTRYVISLENMGDPRLNVFFNYIDKVDISYNTLVYDDFVFFINEKLKEHNAVLDSTDPDNGTLTFVTEKDYLKFVLMYA